MTTASLYFPREREVWVVLCAIVVANALFVLATVAGLVPLRHFSLGRFAVLSAALGSTVFLFRGWRAPFALLRPMTVWRVHPAWLLFALALPPTVATLTLLAKGAVLATGVTELQAHPEQLLKPGMLRAVLIAAFMGEIVWVGYALGRLRQGTTTLVASVIVGAFWTLWWIPIALHGVAIIPGVPLWGLGLSMIGVALMCGFVYAHSQSGLVVFALQVSVNSSLLVFPVAPGAGGIPTFIAFSALYTTVALLLHGRFGPYPWLPARPVQGLQPSLSPNESPHG